MVDGVERETAGEDRARDHAWRPSGELRSRVRRPWRVVLAIVLTGVALTVAAPATGAAGRAPSSVPSPNIDYHFNGNLTDSGGGSTATPSPACPASPCIATSGFGTDANGPYWEWTSTNTQAGGGLRIVTNAKLGDTYTLILKFAFTQTGPGYKKIMDYKDRADDTGFYFHDHYIYFYNLGNESADSYPDGAMMDLVIVRQSTGGITGKFTVYTRVGNDPLSTIIDIDDPSGESIFADSGSGSVIGLFYNDTAYSEASEGGKVYGMSGWANTALTKEQLDEELGLTPTTTTTTASEDPATPAFTG